MKGSRALAIFVLCLLAITGCQKHPSLQVTPSPTPWLTLAVPSATPIATAKPSSRPSVLPTRTLAPSIPSPSPLPTKPKEPSLVGNITLPSLPDPGRSPCALAILNGRLYISNRGSNNVSLIEGNSVKQVLPVGKAPCAITVDPTHKRIYVLNEADASVSVIEGEHVIATWPLTERARSLTLVKEELWLGASQGGRILTYSAKDGRPLGQISLPSNGSIISLSFSLQGQVYALTYGHLYILDPHSRQLLQEREIGQANLMALARGAVLFLAGYEPSSKYSLKVLETPSLKEIASYTLPFPPTALLQDPRDGRLYIVSQTTDKLLVLSRQGELLTQLPVGYQPIQLALDVGKGYLYVLNEGGENVTVLGTTPLQVIQTIPLAPHVTAMDVDPINGRLYIAASSSDSILVYDGTTLREQWQVARYPNQVRVIPSRGWIAVLSLPEAKLLLLNQRGEIVRTHTTGPHPQALAVDELTQRIYAGDTIIEWENRVKYTLRIPTNYHTEESPIQIAIDTRRNIPYIVSFNGVPGSNGGYIVSRWLDGKALAVPTKFNVLYLLYDEELDRLYALYGRMGRYGLQVIAADDGKELLNIPIEQRPLGMVLNPATRHLWLALQASKEPQRTELRIYDTRAMEQAAKFSLDGKAEALAVGLRYSRIYVANDQGRIFIFGDVATPLTKASSLTKPSPEATVPPPPSPTCPARVDARLSPLWEALQKTEPLGCAYSPVQEGTWSIQPFERGWMYRSNTGTIFVLYQEGTFATFHDTWREGQPESCQALPPKGLRKPIRGFGLVWCKEPGVRDKLGWATEETKNVSGLYQTFAQGALLVISQERSLVLFSNGRWRQLPSHAK